jgi:hypothetical protein
MEFARCADPVTGPEYFMSNYFYIQHPVKGKMLYTPFEYQRKLIDTYHNNRFSISLMPRQTVRLQVLPVTCYGLPCSVRTAQF